MTMYYFDLYGWLTPMAMPGRATDVAPPEETEGLRANWTGEEWVLREYVAPPPLPSPVAPVPQTVTMRQARLALLSYGALDDVEAAINAMPEPDRTPARIEWDYSNEVQRYKGLVENVGSAIGLTPEATDELFRLAATL
jgi:hypothetical protein